jgi:hypothetical protein
VAQPTSDIGSGRAKPDSRVAQLTVKQFQKTMVSTFSLAAATAKDKAVSSSFDELGARFEPSDHQQITRKAHGHSGPEVRLWEAFDKRPPRNGHLANLVTAS